MIARLCEWIVLIVVVLFASPTSAQSLDLSSPLGGYVRFGRSAAVQVSGRDLGGEVTLSADGVLPVRIPTAGGRIDAIVPILWQGEPPTTLNWTDGRVGGQAGIALRPLGVDDRLIATAGEDIDAAFVAANLFSAKRPIVLPLETGRQKVASPASAYEAVDLLLLDKSAANRMDESQLRTFLAGGTIVAIRSPVQPIAGWPWVHQGEWWLLRHEVAGPRGGTIPDIYAPTYSWDRSWPESTRQAVVLAGGAGALVLFGLALWRGRWGVLAVAVAGVLATVAAAYYGKSLTPVATAEGDILVADANLYQRDRWTYLSALRDVQASVPAKEGLVKPAFATRRPVDGLSISLLCTAEGLPMRYEATLPAKVTVAFLSRSVWPTTAPAMTPPPVTEPIGLFADKLYPGVLMGQNPARPADAMGDAWWGTVLLKR